MSKNSFTDNFPRSAEIVYVGYNLSVKPFHNGQKL